MIVRVSPLATADSVEFGASQAASRTAAMDALEAVPPSQPMFPLANKPANTSSFRNAALATSPP